MAHDLTNPQVTDDYAPLERLINQALVRYGDYFPETSDGEVSSVMLQYANEVIEEIRQHPYASDEDINRRYYNSITEKRSVPDPIMIIGMAFHYATDQLSAKSQPLGRRYYQLLNSIMWRKLNGNTALQVRVTDGGSHKSYGPESQVTNGLPTDGE